MISRFMVVTFMVSYSVMSYLIVPSCRWAGAHLIQGLNRFLCRMDNRAVLRLRSRYPRLGCLVYSWMSKQWRYDHHDASNYHRDASKNAWRTESA